MKERAFGIILVMVVTLVYWGSFPGAFHYDDFVLLLDSPRVTGSGLEVVDFLVHYGGRPLTLLSFLFNHRLFGSDAFGFHLISVLLHAAVVLLIFGLTSRYFENRFVPFACALLFAVHPAQAEAVNYVWSRAVLLMSCFGLLALWFARHRGLSLLLFQLAVWSRAEALVFLVPLGMVNRKLLRPALLLASLNLVGILAGLVRYAPAEVGWSHSAAWDYWRASLVAYWKYWALMVRPGPFSIYHGPPQTGSLFLLALFGLMAVLMGSLLLWRRHIHRPLTGGILWVSLFLAPSLLVPNAEVVRESRIYLALAGFAVLLGYAALEAGRWVTSRARLGTLPREWAGLALVLPLSFWWGSRVLERHALWADDAAVWREAVALYPEEIVPRYNLAVSLAQMGDLEAACAEFARASHLNPLDDMSYAGLGFCAESGGRWTDACGHYRRALVINPANDYAREGLQRSSGRASAALEHQ